MSSTNHLHYSTIANPIAAPGGLLRVVRGLCVFSSILLLTLSRQSVADETNSPPAASAGSLQDTNLQEVLRAILELGDQIRSNQIAIEQNANAAKEAAAQNAEQVSKGLQGLQETFSSQQQAIAERN